MNDDDNANHIICMVDQINSVLAGEDLASAHTALTLTVAAMIVSTTSERKERIAQAREFAKQLEAYALRDDMVEWIKSRTTHIAVSGRNQ
jgi:hypothetical protein